MVRPLTKRTHYRREIAAVTAIERLVDRAGSEPPVWRTEVRALTVRLLELLREGDARLAQAAAERAVKKPIVKSTTTRPRRKD